MTAALLSIGTELLQGEIANTNAQWLGEHLTQLGFRVGVIEAVADDRDALAEALRRLMIEYRVVIATGGLGPTSDDLTAETVAAVAGVSLELNEDALAAIRRKLEKLGKALKPGHEKQARLPAGSEVLPNGVGTAPGFIHRTNGSTAFFLPGVPAEMKAMFRHHVEPRIQPSANNDSHQIVLHTYGAGESTLGELLAGVEASFPHVTLGYRIKGPDVDVKVFARGPDRAQARERAEAAANEVRDRLGELVYGEGDDTIVQIASRSLRARRWTLSVAESCTGGLIAQQLTSVPASDYFIGGTVAYANTAKTKLLGVSEDTLRGHGAVSAEVAAEMAEGARRAFSCDVAISVTGIAGPTGATSDKPVGLCHWAVAYPGGTVVEESIFAGNRNQVQQMAAHAVLDLLRRVCASAPAPRASVRGSI
jgi:nicotinamide-nucleotide amidase